YKGLETSTRGPLRHGVSVVMSIVRLVVEERPLLFLGVPGVFSLLVGVFFGVWMLQIYAAEHRIITNIALASIAFIIVGLFAVFTAITLYAIARLIQKTNKHK
ncbi:MAG: glycosyltransferase family 2 protein, partial [Candidatus Bathyarchaeales archaeon]